MTSVPEPSPLLSAACEILQHCRDRQLGITLLNKALFYADLRSLLLHGKVITNQPYIALKAGPVVAAYERRLVRDLGRAGLANQIVSDTSKDKPLRLVKDIQTALGSDEKHVLQGTAEWLEHKTATWVSDYSHKNPGWKAAFAAGQEAGLPAAPINMSIALQQLVDDDAWLGAPLTKNESSLSELKGEIRAW